MDNSFHPETSGAVLIGLFYWAIIAIQCIYDLFNKLRCIAALYIFFALQKAWYTTGKGPVHYSETKDFARTIDTILIC